MSVELLKKQLKEDRLEGLYYLYGEEQYLLDSYLKQIRLRCAAVLPELNHMELDGKKLDLDYFSDAVSSCPVMADHKLVVVMDLDSAALKGNGEKKFISALENLAPGVTVLFWEHAREKGKANKLETLLKKQNATVVRLDRLPQEQLTDWILHRFEQGKAAISRRDAQYLAELAGSSMLRLDQEIKKLNSFANGTTLTREIVERMVPPSEEMSWFAITNAVVSHDFDGLMQAVEALYRQNVDDMVIAGMFFRCYMDLWRGKAALKEGKSSTELAAVYGISPYAAARLMRVAAGLREGEAEQGLQKCLKLDRALKTSGLNKKNLIFGLIAELL